MRAILDAIPDAGYLPRLTPIENISPCPRTGSAPPSPHRLGAALTGVCGGLIRDMLQRGHRVLAFAPGTFQRDLRQLAQMGVEGLFATPAARVPRQIPAHEGAEHDPGRRLPRCGAGAVGQKRCNQRCGCQNRPRSQGRDHSARAWSRLHGRRQRLGPGRAPGHEGDVPGNFRLERRRDLSQP